MNNNNNNNNNNNKTRYDNKLINILSQKKKKSILDHENVFLGLGGVRFQLLHICFEKFLLVDA